MKLAKTLIGALLTASCAIAGAADYTTTQALTLTPGDGVLTGGFSNQYGTTGVNYAGKSFMDSFTFTLPDSTSLDSAVVSVATKKVAGVDFTMFELYYGSTQLVSNPGTSIGTGSFAGLSYDGPLAAGDYKLVVDGKFTGTGGGSYGGNVNVAVSPVPEPESWSMLAMGAAGVGFMARRRKSRT